MELTCKFIHKDIYNRLTVKLFHDISKRWQAIGVEEKIKLCLKKFQTTLRIRRSILEEILMQGIKHWEMVNMEKYTYITLEDWNVRI